MGVQDFMGIASIVVLLIVGAIAGWLAGKIVAGYGFGLIGNIVVGILGAFLATLILPRIGIAPGGGFFTALWQSTLGAVVLLALIRVIKKA